MNDDCINRMQDAQNNAMRYMFHAKPREHITPYYAKEQWLRIKERRDLQIRIRSHKILHGYAPCYLKGSQGT
jgi:hypothetical protein